MKQWMGDVFFPNYSDVLLKNVLLPGSHDAGAYSILNTGNQVPPRCGQVDLGDVPNWVLEQLIQWECHQQHGINLVETQQLDIFEQLLAGIRYFDFRLGWYQADQEIRLHHTLFMDATLEEVLNQIFNFLASNQNEVVVMKLRLQCGTPVAGVLTLLDSVLGDAYGGPLTSSVMSSSLSQVKGKAYVIYDKTAALSSVSNSSVESISPDSYYRIHPCDNGNTGTGNTCWAWPDYTQNQGQWLLEQITTDISTDGTQLYKWKGETIAGTFRILSFIGVIPMSGNCTPSNDAWLMTALLTCDHINIDSYTETFQNEFLNLLEVLQTNDMAGAINTIEVDYVNNFQLDALVRLNEEKLQVNSGVSTSGGAAGPSVFPKASGLAGMSPCWDDLKNDNAQELSTPHVKLYDDYSCQGRELTKYSDDDNLKNDVIERFWFWVRKQWNDRVRSVTIVRCARNNLPSGEQKCIDGSLADLRLLLYRDSGYRGTLLILNCTDPNPSQYSNNNESVSDVYNMVIGEYVKTQMACSFNLPDGWVGVVSSLQIQQVSKRRHRRHLEQIAESVAYKEPEWMLVGGISNLRAR